MKIAGYLKTSLIEWPGKIVAVVFTSGCNFRCPFCHNADLVDPKHLGGPRMAGSLQVDEKEIFADLKKRKKWVDGVVVTGGEPTLQTSLSRFLSRCKRMGLEIMIETNGSRPKVVGELIKERLVDFIAMDIKGPLNQQYLHIVGVQGSGFKVQGGNSKLKTLENVKESIKLVISSGVDFEFRTTVVPTIHDKKNMAVLARQLKKLFQTSNSPAEWDPASRDKLPTPNWFLQNFQPKNCLDPKFNKLKPYSPKEMEEVLAVVRKYIPGVELRGR